MQYQRQAYVQTFDTMASSNSSDYHIKKDVAVPDLQYATLVGSNLIGSNLHMPTLDIDHNGVIGRLPTGEIVWWVEGLTPSRWRKARKIFYRAGLSPEHLPEFLQCVRRFPSRENRLSLYKQTKTFNDQLRKDMIVSLHKSDTTQQFDDLKTAVSYSLGWHEQEILNQTNPSLVDPWPILLNCEAMLLPSAKNTHLYLDHTLTWVDYKRLLGKLVSTNLLEDGYVKASKAKGASMLRLPWVVKTSDSGDLVGYDPRVMEASF